MDMANTPYRRTPNTPIPAYNAVNELFRSVEQSWRYARSSDDTWKEFLLKAYQTRFSPQTLAGIRQRMFNDPTFQNMLTYEERAFRKLGQPAVQIDVSRIRNDRFSCISGERVGAEMEMMVLRRDRAIITPSKLDSLNVISHLSICRHAIERIYQRDGLRGRDDLMPRIRDDLVAAERYVAFAFASGLFMGGTPDMPGATTIVPFGRGLLIVRNAILALKPSSRINGRYIYTRNGVQSRPLPVSAELTAIVPDALSDMRGCVVPIGVTYISETLVRDHIEQSAYYSMFREEAHKHDLHALSMDMCFNRLHSHERRAISAPTIELDPQRRLRFLLSLVAKSSDPKEIWVTIGWNQESAYMKNLADRLLPKAA